MDLIEYGAHALLALFVTVTVALGVHAGVGEVISHVAAQAQR